MASARENYRRRALREPAAWFGLGVVAIASVLTAAPLLLAAGLAAQIGFVALSPRLSWYRRHLEEKARRRGREERAQFRAAILPKLDAVDHNRYILLEQRRESIADAASDGQGAPEIKAKLDGLLDQFLRFASQRDDYGDYLLSLLDELKPPQIQPAHGRRIHALKDGLSDEWVEASVDRLCEAYQTEIDELMAKLADTGEENLHNRALYEMRIDVLSQRRNHVQSLRDILLNLNHQLQLLEDTFGLIADELRVRSPDQILADIDDVVTRSDTLSERLTNISLPSSEEVTAHRELRQS